jgi:hypothetical protein
VNLFSTSQKVGLSEHRLETILNRGYLIAGVWNRNFHCELSDPIYKDSSRKELFPTVDNNPEQTYTYILQDETTWTFKKVMLDETVKSVQSKWNSDFKANKYSHTVAGVWTHTNAVYCHPDSLYPAMIAKALGVGLQLVPIFITNPAGGNPEWFSNTHLLAKGLVDIVGSTITPKVSRSFAWQGIALPAYLFTTDVVVIRKSHLRSCTHYTSDNFDDTEPNLKSAIKCLDQAPVVVAPDGSTCAQVFGDLCDKEAITKNPVSDSPSAFCSVEAVAVSAGKYSIARARTLCPERYVDTVVFTLQRDLLANIVYPDVHLYSFSKSVIDLQKFATSENKGLSNPDVGMSSDSSSDNYLIKDYGDKKLVLHGNELMKTYGNIREAYQLIGRNFDTDCPVMYEEFFW